MECQALDYERIAGQWVPNPFGWFAYELTSTSASNSGVGGRDDESMFGGGGDYHGDGTSAYDPFVGGGDFMPNGGTVTSFDGSHFMVMLWDGNLAVYEGASPKVQAVPVILPQLVLSLSLSVVEALFAEGCPEFMCRR